MTGRVVRFVMASFDDYMASIRNVRLDAFLLSRESRPWTLERCRLGPCVLQHGADAAPYAASGSAAPGILTFLFAGGRDAAFRVDGGEVGEGTVLRWGNGAKVSLIARRPADWFTVSATSAEVAAVFERPGGLAPALDPSPLLVDLRPEGIEKLRALARGAFESVEAAGPGGLPPEDGARLGRALLEAVVSETAGAARRGRRSRFPRIGRPGVLARVEEVLAAREAEPLYVAELCSATGLPERTLRHIVSEQYGTSPVRLLRSYRLCRLRRELRELREAADGGASIAAIAARHGFRHMGQLAADYRRLFGELPSETLRVVRELPPRPLGSPAAVRAQPAPVG